MKLEQLFPRFCEAEDKLAFVKMKALERSKDLKKYHLAQEVKDSEKKPKKTRKRKTKADEVSLSTEELALMQKLGLTKSKLLAMRKG